MTHGDNGKQAQAYDVGRIANGARRVLFTAYAPVHVVCWLPIYRRLARDPRVELWVSGGFKVPDAETSTYSLKGFYDPFPVDHDRVIPVERALTEHFDVLVASQGSANLLPRSVGRKVQVFHGVSFKNLLARKKYMDYDFLCLPGRYHGELYRRRGLIRPGRARCLVTGFPKVDPLVTGELDRAALLRRNGVDPALPAILYAPTGSKHNSMETMGLDVIRNIAATGKWNLLVKLHDHPKRNKVDWPAEVGKLESDRVRLVRDLDVVPYLHAADLLITDASSVSVEYSLLDRPMIFLDVPKLLENVVERGGALDLDTYGRGTGTLVRGPEEAAGAIESALANPEREQELRRRMARHVFHDPGRASQRVAGVVLHAAGLEPSLPAGVGVLEPEEIPQETCGA